MSVMSLLEAAAKMAAAAKAVEYSVPIRLMQTSTTYRGGQSDPCNDDKGRKASVGRMAGRGGESGRPSAIRYARSPPHSASTGGESGGQPSQQDLPLRHLGIVSRATRISGAFMA